MPAIATLCDGCHHPEDEHHIKKENWLECFHPGCNCESYKGFAYWNERENTVDIDHSARLAEGQRRWGSENAQDRNFKVGDHVEVHGEVGVITGVKRDGEAYNVRFHYGTVNVNEIDIEGIAAHYEEKK